MAEFSWTTGEKSLSTGRGTASSTWWSSRTSQKSLLRESCWETIRGLYCSRLACALNPIINVIAMNCALQRRELHMLFFRSPWTTSISLAPYNKTAHATNPQTFHRELFFTDVVNCEKNPVSHKAFLNSILCLHIPGNSLTWKGVCDFSYSCIPVSFGHHSIYYQRAWHIFPWRGAAYCMLLNSYSMLDSKLNVKEELSISLTAIAVTEPTISALMPNILYKQCNSNQTRDVYFTLPLKFLLDGFICSSQCWPWVNCRPTMSTTPWSLQMLTPWVGNP